LALLAASTTIAGRMDRMSRRERRACIVGAGPAGVAVAEALRAAGIAFDVYDENPRPGGNIWRRRVDAPPAPLEQMMHGTANRLRLGTSVIAVNGLRLRFDRGRGPEAEAYDAVFLAAGAYDAQLPRPGQPRPNVSTAGALQALLKGQGLVPDGPVVVAGAGPFLYIVAADLVRAGATVTRIIDRVPRRRYVRLLRQAPPPARSLAEFVRAWWVLRLQSVAFDFGAGVARIDPGVATLLDGRRVTYGHLAISDFFAPQTQLARTAGCAVSYAPAGRYFRVAADPYGRTDRPGLYVCGEAQGVRGGAHAVVSGRLAVHAYRCDRGEDLPEPAKLLARRHRLAAFGEALEHAMYADEPLPDDAAWACGCERVPLARLREAVEFGLQDLGSLKGVTRLGMGICQGRYCEPVACRALAAAGREPQTPLTQKTLVRPVLARALADA
jgi:NADPH-dependent 2,4-dienoyl-CoA reductase/sulfur reductase-like enzyme